MIRPSHTISNSASITYFGAQSEPLPLRSVSLPRKTDDVDAVEFDSRPALVSVSDDMADDIVQAQQNSSKRKRRGNIITGSIAGLFALLAAFVGADTLDQHGARAEAMAMEQDAQGELSATQSDIQNYQTQLEIQPQVEASFDLAATALSDAETVQSELEADNVTLDEAIADQQAMERSLSVPLEQGQTLFDIEANPNALPAQELAELNNEAVGLLIDIASSREAIESIEQWYADLADINARAAEQATNNADPAEIDGAANPVGVPAPSDQSNNDDAVAVPTEQDFECVDNRGGIIGTIDKWLVPPAC